MVDSFISYPRTETEVFKEGTDLLGLIQPHTAHPVWGAYASKLVDHVSVAVAVVVDTVSGVDMVNGAVDGR